MKRYKIELSTIVELFVPAEDIEGAHRVARDFISRQKTNGALSYKLHAIYDTEHEVTPSPSGSDAQQVAA